MEWCDIREHNKNTIIRKAASGAPNESELVVHAQRKDIP